MRAGTINCESTLPGLMLKALPKIVTRILMQVHIIFNCTHYSLTDLQNECNYCYNVITDVSSPQVHVFVCLSVFQKGEYPFSCCRSGLE